MSSASFVQGLNRLYLSWEKLFRSKQAKTAPGRNSQEYFGGMLQGKTTSYQSLAFHHIGLGIYLYVSVRENWVLIKFHETLPCNQSR